ncbi:hypothetical protein NSERUTF1_1062 [Nocardia seriolae]|nr:hypothetical protein NSERUTF1_1062 [Nocardia seriolae]
MTQMHTELGDMTIGHPDLHLQVAIARGFGVRESVLERDDFDPNAVNLRVGVGRSRPVCRG